MRGRVEPIGGWHRQCPTVACIGIHAVEVVAEEDALAVAGRHAVEGIGFFKNKENTVLPAAGIAEVGPELRSGAAGVVALADNGAVCGVLIVEIVNGLQGCIIRIGVFLHLEKTLGWRHAKVIEDFVVTYQNGLRPVLQFKDQGGSQLVFGTCRNDNEVVVVEIDRQRIHRHVGVVKAQPGGIGFGQGRR